MKTDARTRYTLKTIKETFTCFLKEMPVNKITVKNLCEKAGINRATFYRYYEDIFDLYEKFKEEIIDEIVIGYDESLPHDIESDFLFLLGRIKENSEAMFALSKQADSYEIMTRMCRKNYAYFENYFNSIGQELNESDKLVMFYYITCGCTGVFSEWICRGMQKDERDLAKIITRMFINTMRGM